MASNYILHRPKQVGLGTSPKDSSKLKPRPHSRLHGAPVDDARLTPSPHRCSHVIVAVPGHRTATGSFEFCSRSPRFLSTEGFSVHLAPRAPSRLCLSSRPAQACPVSHMEGLELYCVTYLPPVSLTPPPVPPPTCLVQSHDHHPMGLTLPLRMRATCLLSPFRAVYLLGFSA